MAEQDVQPWKRLQELVEESNIELLREETEQLGHRETARAISRLDPDMQTSVLTALEPTYAADLIEEFSDAQAADLISHLEPGDAAPILNEMVSDETADLLTQLQPGYAEEVLGEMDEEAAGEAKRLAEYAPDVAGGLMITEYLAYPEDYRTREVIADMREHAEEYREYTVQYSYVVSGSGELVGVLPLRDLLLTPGDVPISKIMIGNPLSVGDDTSLEALAEFFDEHHFVGVPVTDSAGKLLGVVEPDDVEEALGHRAESDYLKTQGIVGGDELRSMPLLRRSRRRLSWLSVNILLNIVAASVIALYQDTLESVIALAVFLPIISDMSGCSGNQAVAVSMRELALGLVKPFEVLHVWWKEVTVGAMNGFALGILIAIAALIWKGNPYLGLVVGSALMLNTMVAVSLGGILPLGMKLLKMDPALASGPILTTVTDMFGFFLVLSFATLLLPHLV